MLELEQNWPKSDMVDGSSLRRANALQTQKDLIEIIVANYEDLKLCVQLRVHCRAIVLLRVTFALQSRGPAHRQRYADLSH